MTSDREARPCAPCAGAGAGPSRRSSCSRAAASAAPSITTTVIRTASAMPKAPYREARTMPEADVEHRLGAVQHRRQGGPAGAVDRLPDRQRPRLHDRGQRTTDRRQAPLRGTRGPPRPRRRDRPGTPARWRPGCSGTGRTAPRRRSSPAAPAARRGRPADPPARTRRRSAAGRPCRAAAPAAARPRRSAAARTPATAPTTRTSDRAITASEICTMAYQPEMVV